MRRGLVLLLLAAAPGRAAGGTAAETRGPLPEESRLLPPDDGVTPAAPPVEDDETAASAPPLAPAPSRFSGDLRTRVGDLRPRSASFNGSSPERRHGPAFSQRLRLRWGDRLAAGVFLSRPSPGPSLTMNGLSREGTFKRFLSFDDRFLLGDYKLSYGQGLLFYGQLGEFVRPPLVRGGGAAPDLSAARGEYLRGAVVRGGKGSWTAEAFLSRQGLDVALGPDGLGEEDLWALRNGAVPDPEARNAVEERAAGGRLEGRWKTAEGGVRAGLTAAGFRYSPALGPSPRPYSDGSLFRGGENALAGADLLFERGDRKAALDIALSDGARRGSAAAATLLQKAGRARAWATLFSYGAGYFSRHGKGPAFEVGDLPGALPSNQRGLSLGARGEGPAGHLEGEAAWARFPAAQGDGSNQDPVLSSQGRRARVEGGLRFSPGWEGLLRFQERVRDKSVSPPGGGARAQGAETVRKLRAETLWRAAPGVRMRTRYDVRWERTPLAGRRAEGRLILGELSWAPSGAWSLEGRVAAFHSPSASLTAGVEEVWDGVVSPLLPGGMGTFRGAAGEKYGLAFRRRWGAGLSTWIKYDETLRWRGAASGDARRSWRFQTDAAW